MRLSGPFNGSRNLIHNQVKLRAKVIVKFASRECKCSAGMSQMLPFSFVSLCACGFKFCVLKKAARETVARAIQRQTVGLMK